MCLTLPSGVSAPPGSGMSFEHAREKSAGAAAVGECVEGRAEQSFFRAAITSLADMEGIPYNHTIYSMTKGRGGGAVNSQRHASKSARRLAPRSRRRTGHIIPLLGSATIPASSAFRACLSDRRNRRPR